MERRSSYVALNDAQILSSKEEYALDTEQRSNYVAMKDAQIKLGKEECAEGMEHTALQTTSLLLLDQGSRRLRAQLVLLTRTKEVLAFLERLSSAKKS